MNRLYKYLKTISGIVMGILSLMLYSCEGSVVDLDPVNVLTDETAYSTAERCKLSLVGAYDAAQCGQYSVSAGWSRGYPLGSASVMQGEMRGEDMVNRASFYQYTYESTYNAASTQNNIAFWNCSFEAINRINVVMEGEQKAHESGVINDAVYTQYNGELAFLRGIIYHYLMIHFAEPYNLSSLNNDYGLPIYLTPHTTESSIGEGLATHRSKVEETYTQIIKDLETAAANLPTTNSDNNITRATKGAAYAFLSRVYLHMRNWAKVEEYAKKVIDLGTYSLEKDPITPFTSFNSNSESIFSIENNANDNGSVNGAMFSMFSCRNGSRYLVSMSPILVNDTRWLQDDKRRSEWLLSSESSDAVTKKYNVYFCDKYRSDTRSDYAPIIRYAEVLLNYAEAAARLGDTETALKYLNMVRNRSLADDSKAYATSDFADKKALVEAILFERRIEFLGEGRRWEDIHRLAADDLCPTGGIPAKVKWTAISKTAAADAVCGYGKAIPTKGLSAYPYSDKRFLWPIPVSETTYNEVLAAEQNAGW